MDLDDLERLHSAVEALLQQESFSSAVERLRLLLGATPEPFVWSTLALDTIGVGLPAPIKSCWIFILKRNVPSGCHFHPNSIQHMIAINGRGRSKVEGVERSIIPIASAQHSIAEKRHVIGQGVPHEFLPEGEDMLVVSFHTCEGTELEEIDYDSGARRIYETAEVAVLAASGSG